MFVGRGEGLDRGEGFPTRGGQAWGDGTEAEARRAWTQRVCRWSCVSSLAGRALSAFWGAFGGQGCWWRGWSRAPTAPAPSPRPLAPDPGGRCPHLFRAGRHWPVCREPGSGCGVWLHHGVTALLPKASRTNNHTLGGLKHQKCIPLPLALGAEAQNAGPRLSSPELGFILTVGSLGVSVSSPRLLQGHLPLALGPTMIHSLTLRS